MKRRKSELVSIDKLLEIAKEPVPAARAPRASIDDFDEKFLSFRQRITPEKVGEMQARRDMLTPLIGAPDPQEPVSPLKSWLPAQPHYEVHQVCGHIMDGTIKFLQTGRIVYHAQKGQVGEVIECPHCTAASRREHKQRTAEANLSRLFQDADIPAYGKNWTFGNYPNSKDPDARDEIEQLVMESIEAMQCGNKGTNIYLHGKPGGGKTSLAIAALHTYMEEGFSCLHMLVRKYFRLLHESYNKDASPDLLKLQSVVLNVPVLVLDDLGSEHQSKNGADWAIGQIFDLIEERLASGLVTIVTSNDSVKVLGKRYYNHTQDHDVQQQIGRVLRRLNEYYRTIEILSGDEEYV